MRTHKWLTATLGSASNAPRKTQLKGFRKNQKTLNGSGWKGRDTGKNKRDTERLVWLLKHPPQQGKSGC